MATNPETKLERAVCRYATKTYGMLTYKFSSPSRVGVPDRIFITREGLIAFIEFKQPGDKARFLENPRTKTEHAQHRELARLTEYRCETFVIDDETEGRKLVDLLSDARAYAELRYERENDLILPSSVSGTRH